MSRRPWWYIERPIPWPPIIALALFVGILAWIIYRYA